MQKKDNAKLFIDQFLRGGIKCIPIVGAGIEEIIFGFKDKQQAQEEKEILWKTLDEIKISKKIDQMTGLQVIELLLELTKEYELVQKSINQFIEKIQSKNQQIIKYLTTTIDLLNNSLNLKYFIDLKCLDEEHRRTILIKDYICEWMKDPNVTTLAILGDFGTGKTTFSQKLTLEYSKKYLDNPNNNYLPIMIDLRSFTHLRNVEELLKNALMWKGIDYEVFFQLFQDSKILFILDGFDEMSLDVQNSISFENFLEINKLISDKNKLIITSRTHYFKQRKDEESILKIKAKDFSGISLYEKEKIKTVYLEMFNEEDIEKYLKLYFNEEWKRHHEKLKSIYNLTELAHRPILLNLIVQTISELNDFKGEITQNNLYEIYIDRWIKREEWRDINSKDVLFLMEDLAFEKYVNNKRITPYELNGIIKEKYDQKILSESVNIEDFEGKIRTSSFLYRDKYDDYSFMHKSFMEFFIAKKFAKEIIEGNKNNFGEKPITTEIGIFLINLIKDENVINNLNNFIYSTEKKGLYDLILKKEKFLGGNSILILKLLGFVFSGKDFSNTILINADFSNTDLTNTNFSGSILDNSNFSKAVLVNTNFSKANLEGAIFKEMGAVFSLAWSPDGKYLASGGEDALVRIWNTKTYEKVVLLKGHQDVIKCLCWSSDCSLLASGSHDKNIVIWDTLEWKLVTILKGHHGEIESLIWNEKNYLISGDSDGNINIWNADKSWKIQHKISIKNKINRLRFLDSLNYLIVSSGEGIKVFKTDTYKEIFQLCNFNTIFDIDKKTNSLIYLNKYELKEFPWYWQDIKDYKIKELIRFNIENYYSEKIKSWIHEYEYDDGDEYSTMYKVVDLVHSNKKNNFAILLKISEYDYDLGSDKTDLWHYRNVIFFNGKNEKILKHSRAFVIDYSIDDRYIASGETEAIRIFDADPESPKYGECIHIIKRLINCKGMNINNVYGLENEQIEILKRSGAEGESLRYAFRYPLQI